MKIRSAKSFTGSWTKYGGQRQHAYDINQSGHKVGEYYCQACGKLMPPEIGYYKVKYLEEFIKICAICYAKPLKFWEKEIKERISHVDNPNFFE